MKWLTTSNFTETNYYQILNNDQLVIIEKRPLNKIQSKEAIIIPKTDVDKLIELLNNVKKLESEK